MIIPTNLGATAAAVTAQTVWSALLVREEPIPAGELLQILQSTHEANPAAPVPAESARTIFRAFWQAQLDDFERA